MKNKTQDNHEIYKKARNDSSKIHREAKEAFEMRLADEIVIEQVDY